MRPLSLTGGLTLSLALAGLGLAGCASAADGEPSTETLDQATLAVHRADCGDHGDRGHGHDDRCEPPDDRGGKRARVFAVYGDAPYGTTPTDTTEFDATPAFIDAVNADPDVSMVLHVGDIHSGKQYCTEDYDQSIFELWQGFDDPMVYTPGDNEWTDCHKKAEGGGTYDATTQAIDYVVDANGDPVDYASGNPAANLELIRSIFFAHPGQTLGSGSERVLSQAQCAGRHHPGDRSFVENVMWKSADVLFVAINLPGGSNNDTDPWYGVPAMSDEQAAEVATRTDADLRWLDQAFATAGEEKVAGVVIMAQADMWDPEKGAEHQAQYEPFIANIAAHTLAFGKPVLMLNGDSHDYQSSNPLAADNADAQAIHPGYDVPNFHRVVVHGSTLPLEYLRLTVDHHAHAANGEDAFGPFSWSRVIPNP